MSLFLFISFTIICILLILVILLQKGRGGGLGAAFGGAGSSAFGTRTGDVFTWVTIVLTSLFLLLSVATVIVYKPAQVAINPPSMTPPASPIAGPVQVTLVRNQKKAKTYYTTDLSDPTASSTLYVDEPIAVNPGDTIKAKNLYSGRWSETTVGNYTVIGAASQPTSQVSTRQAGSTTTQAGADTAETLPAVVLP
jgi:protein translocase SecG subunit